MRDNILSNLKEIIDDLNEHADSQALVTDMFIEIKALLEQACDLLENVERMVVRKGRGRLCAAYLR